MTKFHWGLIMGMSEVLNNIHRQIQPLLGQGEVADYIPALANQDPHQFSMAITLNTGQFFGIGDYEKQFSIQSISKVFSYTLALRAYKNDLFQRVWREPSGTPFNSLVQLEHEAGIPRNPFINSGAIVVCDSLISYFGEQGELTSREDNFSSAFTNTLDLIQDCSADNTINFNQRVLDSELANGFRNQAQASLIKSFGNLDNNIDQVLSNYFQQCAIEMNVQQLSRAMLFLANNGTDPISKKQFITESQAKRINSLMLTCGHYDASGDFAFQVGLPGKSGVGGGIVAVIPNKMSIAVYSPALNKNGNSLVGTKALELFTTLTGLSIF